MLKLFPLFLLLFFGVGIGKGQEIPAKKIIENTDLANFLSKDSYGLLKNGSGFSNQALASYFRNKFSDRYFYDWKTFQEKFEIYKADFPERARFHEVRANEHIKKFQANTDWLLPFMDANSVPVDVYSFRHLARQHKMLDVAFTYFYKDQDPKYINYFLSQLHSLNSALLDGKYETLESGNGVYEAFRSGYRILNWLQIHNMLLGQEEYTDENQLTTIATLLQHGSDLYESNPEFVPGNHQTRGLSALAMLSMLFKDFRDSDIWFDHAMMLLEKHLIAEINEDGFQFERSVHYHISDIENYFNVYRLAQIGDFELSDVWTNKMKQLFQTLIDIGYPDKSLPVLQDDTDSPWAERNEISGIMTLGYLLFQDPKMGFFKSGTIDPKTYWYIDQDQFDLLQNIPKEFPGIKSLALPATGYYVMREGWESLSKYMIISAGLDELKPDHQHGDMLGIQAMANGKVILPNYLVRYSLNDLELFKNSLVKNVALVDSELQGKMWTSNKGGSGFGKFRELPNPKVIAWDSNEQLDYFVGSHDGFKNINVSYSRQVIYLKDDFWIVKDNFSSKGKHDFKQVWQGHYTMENAPNLIRSSFDNGSGCDIFQLRSIDQVVTNGKRGKEWSVATKLDQENFQFITAIFPFQNYLERINEEDSVPNLGLWVINKSGWQVGGKDSVSISKWEQSLFFSVNKLEVNDIKIEFSGLADVYIRLYNDKLFIQSLGDQNFEISILGIQSIAGKEKNSEYKMLIRPAEVLECML